MADNTNKTLISFINQAITDFDEIYTVLHAKKTTDAAATGDTGVATSEYANLINTNLIKVKDLTVAQLGGVADNQLTAYTATHAQTDITHSISFADNRITIEGLLPGYYSSAAKIQLTDANLFTTANDDNLVKQEADGKITGWTITPTSKIISKVELAAGTVTPSVKSEAGTGADAPTISSSSTLAASGNLAINKLTEGSVPTGAYQFTITTDTTASGKYVLTGTETRTKGYVEAGTTNATADLTLEGLTPTALQDTYYIEKGSIALNSITIADKDITSTDVEFAESGYAITSTISQPVLKVNQTAGYVEAGTAMDLEIKDWNSVAATKYIKKGAVDNQATPTKMAPTFGSSIGTTTTPDDVTNVIEIKATVANSKVTPVITEGYVKPEVDTKDLEVEGGEASLYINKGSSTAAISSVSATPQANDVLAAGSTAYPVTFTLNAKAAGTVTEGYQAGGAITIADRTVDDYTVYIKEGSASLTGAIQVDYVDREDNLAKPSASIFLSEAPAKGDYYTVTDNHEISVTAGYITGAAKGVHNTYYVPRATFEYVDAGTDNIGDNFLQVVTGGYVPAGLITEIADITGNIDEAALTAKLDTTLAGFTKVTGTDDSSIDASQYYIINLQKDSVSDAGYISANQGTLTGKYTLKKGLSTVTGEVTSVAVKEGAVVTKDTASGKYTLAIESKGTLTHTVTEGYVTATDKAGEVNFAKEGSVELAAATFALETTQITGVEIKTAGVTTAESGAYYVETALADNALNIPLTVNTASEGYIGKDEKVTVNPTLQTSKVYIKAGVQNTAVNGNGAVTLESDFAESKDGVYKVFVAADQKVAVKGTLEAGYYGSEAERAVSGNATVTGSLDIAHGKVNVSSISVDASVTAVGETEDKIQIKSVLADGETASQFYQVKPVLGTVTDTTTVTAGYIKEADVTIPETASNSSSAAFYVKKFSATVGDDSNYVGVAGGFGVDADGNAVDSVVLETEHSYSTKDITVTLHEDACGSSVRSALSALEARLAGSNVKAVSLAL